MKRNTTGVKNVNRYETLEAHAKAMAEAIGDAPNKTNRAFRARQSFVDWLNKENSSEEIT